MQRNEFDDRLYVASHPIRRHILLSLEKSRSYASKLAEDLSLNPKVAQFHLAHLEKYGLVEAKFGLETSTDSRPVAVKYYTLTKDGHSFAGYLTDVARKAAKQ